MCESEKIRRAILNDHVGENVTVVLDATQSNVFQGVLNRLAIQGPEDAECWVITADRGLIPQGHQKIAVPETKIYFTTADFKYLIIPQETEEEAAEKIESENINISLAAPGGGRFQ